MNISETFSSVDVSNQNNWVLPDEVVGEITKCCNNATLRNLRQVSKDFNSAICRVKAELQINELLPCARLLKFSNVKQLTLCDFPDYKFGSQPDGHKSVKHQLSGLKDLSHLSSLCLDTKKFADIDLLELNYLSNLKELTLRKVGGFSPGKFSFLSSLNQLQKLTFNSHAPDLLAKANVFKTIAKLPNLQSLQLSIISKELLGDLVNDQCTKFEKMDICCADSLSLEQLASFPNLRDLALSKYSFDQNHFSSLNRLSQVSQLTFGTMYSGNIEISVLPQNLKSLWANERRFNELSWHLSTHLTEIDALFCKFDLQSILGLSHLKELRKLNLTGSTFPKGFDLHHLASFDHLQDLTLRCCLRGNGDNEVGELNKPNLSNQRIFRSLSHLDLWDCVIDVERFDIIKSIAELSKLILMKNRLSSDQMKALTQVNDNLEIELQDMRNDSIYLGKGFLCG